MVARVAIAIGAAVRGDPIGFAPSRKRPFVVSLSNHERPFDKLRAIGSLATKRGNSRSW